MKLLFVLLLAACQHGEDPSPGSAAAAVVPPVPAPPAPIQVPTSSPYMSDIQKICNALHLSGADTDPGGAQVTVAMWLGANLETTKAHDFLVEIAPLVGAPKADRLDGEAKKVGLPGCALAASWR